MLLSKKDFYISQSFTRPYISVKPLDKDGFIHYLCNDGIIRITDDVETNTIQKLFYFDSVNQAEKAVYKYILKQDKPNTKIEQVKSLVASLRSDIDELWRLCNETNI